MTGLHAPWRLRGEAVIATARGSGDRRRRSSYEALPAGLAPLGGPTVIVLERYEDSPAGPFVALSVGRPARIGLRPGICFTVMAVDNHDRLTAGRLNWGFPGEIGTLTWDASSGDRTVVRWVERGLSVEVWQHRRLVVPGVVPVRALQRRADGPVVVPTRYWGRLHPARISVVVPDDDPLQPVSGEHGGIWVKGLRGVVRPARHPRGLLSSLPAPSTAPEPGWSYRVRSMSGG